MDMKSRVVVAVVGLGALLIGIAIGRSFAPRPTKPQIKQEIERQPVLGQVNTRRAGDLVPKKAVARSAEIPALNMPRDLAAQIKDALARSGSRRAFVRLSNLIDSIDVDHVRQVLNFAQTLKPQDRSSLIPLVIARWAELNPAD